MQRGLVQDAAGTPLTHDTPYRSRFRVAYYREVADEPNDRPEIPILYRDEDLLVVDKPPFLPVTPSGPWVQRCVLYRLSQELDLPGLTPIHRLDRATAGVLLFATAAKAAAPWSELFRTGAVERFYEAEAAAARKPERSSWVVENRLEKGKPFFTMRIVPGSPNARTEIELLNWRPDSTHAGIAHFVLRPTTGRQHQLRLHLASLGYPILGDRLYPTLTPEGPDDTSDPLRLVARRLGLVDPRTGNLLVFTSCYELPEARTVGHRTIHPSEPSPRGSNSTVGGLERFRL